MLKTLALLMLLICVEVHAAFIVNTMSNVTATTTSTKILEGVLNRNYLLIINNGTVPVYVKVGGVQSGNEGVTIGVGGNWEPNPEVPADAMYIKTASSTASVTILEGKNP